MPIYFFQEDINFLPPNTNQLSDWLLHISHHLNYKILELNYIYCSDSYLLEINRQYLDHDFYTDIITFDNSDNARTIEADIFISIDRVRENAQQNRIAFHNELFRIMAHGLLHLMGFNDKKENEILEMREKEEWALSLLNKRST